MMPYMYAILTLASVVTFVASFISTSSVNKKIQPNNHLSKPTLQLTMMTESPIESITNKFNTLVASSVFAFSLFSPFNVPPVHSSSFSSSSPSSFMSSVFSSSSSPISFLQANPHHRKSHGNNIPFNLANTHYWKSHHKPVPFSLANTFASASTTTIKTSQKVLNSAIERSRLKRTIAVKEMESKGIIKVETDDSGNQFLSLPWIPDKKVPYKSLPLQRRLFNEVCAGAFGEFCKDLILHPVDTLKTRRQAAKKKKVSEENSNIAGTGIAPVHTESFDIKNVLFSFKELYSGFPVVMCASIPQGATFFLLKKGLLEFFGHSLSPSFFESIVSSSLGTSGYWGFRTPAGMYKC